MRRAWYVEIGAAVPIPQIIIITITPVKYDNDMGKAVENRKSGINIDQLDNISQVFFREKYLTNCCDSTNN